MGDKACTVCSDGKSTTFRAGRTMEPEDPPAWLDHRYSNAVIGGFALTWIILIAHLGLDIALQLLFWCLLLVLAVRTYGPTKVALTILTFVIYVLLPIYIVFVMSPYILFLLKFILCLVVGTASMIGALHFFTWKKSSPRNLSTTTTTEVSDITTSDDTTSQTGPHSQDNPNPLLLKNSSSADLSASMCVICQVEQKCIVFLPCAHMCVCKQCRSKHLEHSNKCPICRAKIDDTMLVFL